MTPRLLLSRRSLIGAGALLGGVGLASCNRTAASSQGGVTLRQATYRGQIDGFFHQAGLSDPPYRTTTAEFASGALIAEAINARAIDIGGMSEIPPIFIASAPGDLVRLIAVLRSDVNNQVVLVPRGSTLKALSDLKGRRIGYVRATTSHYILLHILKELGLGWGDITPVALSPQDGYAAFQQGSLDAWVIYGIVVDQARAAGARVLTTARGRLSGNYVIAASSEAVADPGKHQAIADYLQRYKRTLAWINADPDRWAAARAAATGVPAIYYRQELREQSTTPALSPITDDAIRSQQAVADAFADAKVIPARVDVRPLWNRSFSDVLKA